MAPPCQPVQAALTGVGTISHPGSRPIQLAGKFALVTGGTRGLGRELAIALATDGADVAVLGRDPAGGDAVAAAISAQGRRGLAVAADVTDGEAIEAAVATVLAQFGQIDILVCNAGVGTPRRPIWEATADDWRHCFEVNVLGVMMAIKAVAPHMIARRSGRIVAIGGTYGHKGVAGSAIYASSKWALRGLIKSTALELGQFGVNANVIAPGGVDGERLRKLFRDTAITNGEREEAVLARFTAGTALNRLGTADDVAAMLLHVVGPAGRNITGQDLIVDAGTIV